MFGGLPGEFLDLALAGGFLLITSPALLDELEEKLRDKFEVSGQDVERVRRKLEATAEVVSTKPMTAVILDDPDDDRVLECAVAGRWTRSSAVTGI
jgi:predicted nucleic acid-binding protein